ncbi:FAD-dependent oxidoreductase [Flavobacterium sp.]|uniref:FAD-dependent oxidoreductase n=1 Tax=Flavobacterium sp. TaxID=239 RepID=UPI003751E923
MKNNLTENKKIAIIGGGPVGLTTAILLQQKGVNVKVYERDLNAETRISGGTLDIHNDTGQLAFVKAGLLELFFKNARPTGERAIDIQANVVEEVMPTEENKFERPEIDRNDMRRILLESLNENTVEWDSQLINLEKKENQFHLQFKNGKNVIADIVIVANGGQSNARKYVTDLTPKYTGTFVLQGEVLNPEISCPNYKNLCKEENTMTISDRKMLFCQVKAKGALNYYLSFKADEDWAVKANIDLNNKESIVAFMNEKCANWHPTFKELFAATDNFTSLAMRMLNVENGWKSKETNITLVGDAAHLMPPFAGVGVNVGLLDALNLAINLTEGDFSDIDAAIKDYEQKMFVYAAEAQDGTSQAEEGIHSDISFEELMKQREEGHRK